MPPPWVYRGSDGALMLSDGVTRATRIANLCPERRSESMVVRTVTLGHFPTVGDLLP